MALLRNISGSFKASCWWPIPKNCNDTSMRLQNIAFNSKIQHGRCPKWLIWEYCSTRHDAPNLKRSVLWFLAKPFTSYKQNMHFSYLLTTNTHRVSSQYAKPLQRYSLRSIFAGFLENSLVWYLRTLGRIDLNSIHFCHHGLQMIWANFGGNLGRVWQSSFSEQLKIAKKRNLTITKSKITIFWLYLTWLEPRIQRNK